MTRRPKVTDRIAYIAARLHAQRVYGRFIRATRDAAAIQERTLLRKIRRNAETGFGRDHRFDRIHSAADFSRHVPILRYEEHRPYIERVKNGDIGAMFGRGQRVHMFALTSGTTDEPKYIPITTDFLDEYRDGWNAFGIKALLDHPKAFLRGIMQVTSRMDESHAPAGIPCGAITGLMAATQKRLVRKYYVSPQCLGEIDEPAAKYYTIMRLAVASDVAFAITASPATQLKLARTADAHREQLIRDIHDGALWDELPVPDHVRRKLQPQLRHDPGRARELEALAAEHGQLLPRHYWNLAFLANWTGGTMGLYLREFPHYFGDVPVRDIGLLASEGRVSIPIEDGTPAGVLDVVSNFFEFVPRDRIDQANPPALRCHQVEVGQEYFVIMTTSSGLYRYDLRDLVRVVDFVGQAPVIEFLNKGEHVCSLAGEKLTEHQVILAMERATRHTNANLANFVLAPKWDEPPHYMLHAEPEPDAIPEPRASARAVSGTLSDPAAALNPLAAELDNELARVNVEYASRRRSDRLGPVQLNVLPSGLLTRRDHDQAEARRKGNEQYKHRYLYCQPGDDAGLPTGVTSEATS